MNEYEEVGDKLVEKRVVEHFVVGEHTLVEYNVRKNERWKTNGMK